MCVGVHLGNWGEEELSEVLLGLLEGVPAVGVVTGGGGSVTSCHGGREAGTSSERKDVHQAAPPGTGIQQLWLQGNRSISCGCRAGTHWKQINQGSF